MKNAPLGGFASARSIDISRPLKVIAAFTSSTPSSLAMRKPLWTNADSIFISRSPMNTRLKRAQEFRAVKPDLDFHLAAHVPCVLTMRPASMYCFLSIKYPQMRLSRPSQNHFQHYIIPCGSRIAKEKLC